MKRVLSIIFLAALTTVLGTSCKKDTDYVSTITYQVVITLEEGSLLIWPVGTPFVDPGFTAIEKGKDVHSKVEVDGASDITGMDEGVFGITYSAVNEDGWPVSVSRKVVVLGAVAAYDIAGTYNSDISRSYNSLTASRSSTVNIDKIVDGVYNISCLLGGWYFVQYGADYGSLASASGIIKVNPDDTIDILEGYIPLFGAEIESFDPANTKVDDPIAGVITLCTIMSDTPTMEFTVTLTK